MKLKFRRSQRPAPDLLDAMYYEQARVTRELVSGLSWLLEEQGISQEQAATRAKMRPGQFLRVLHYGGPTELVQLAALLGYRAEVALRRTPAAGPPVT